MRPRKEPNFPWEAITTTYPFLDALKKPHRNKRALTRALQRAVKEEAKNEAKRRCFKAYLEQRRKEAGG